MEATYKLNTRELNLGFITSLQNMYPDQDIEIIVREDAMDATDYLLSSPVMQERLDKAIDNVSHGRNLITFDTIEDAVRCVKERNEKKKQEQSAL